MARITALLPEGPERSPAHKHHCVKMFTSVHGTAALRRLHLSAVRRVRGAAPQGSLG